MHPSRMHALVRPVALRRVFLGIGFVVGMRGALLAQPTPAGESPPVSTAGVRFMTGMILHHAQALEMTALITGRSADDRLARLGERIAVSQRDEIALMAEWLRDRRQALPDPASPHTHHEHGPMPGMASPADMAALADLRGAAFDRRFLTLMIRHHEGALSMVADLLKTPRAAQEVDINVFANDVETTQTAEIGLMRQMLLEY